MADLSILIRAMNEASPEIEEVNRSLGELGPAADDAEGAVSDSFGTMMDNINITMLGIFAAIEIGKTAFEALQNMYEGTVGKALDIAGEIEELMRVSGEAPEKLSALRIEAEKADVPFDDLYKAMENLNKNGIPPTVDNLVAIADEYVRLQDPIAQAALLTENFGTAGDEIAPMLEAIAGGIEAVDNAGLIFTEEEIQAAKDYKQAVSDLSSAWEGFSTTIGMAVIPSLTDFLGQFQNTITSTGLLSEYVGLLNEQFGENKDPIEYAKGLAEIMNIDLASTEGLDLLRTKIGELDETLHADQRAALDAALAHNDLVTSIYESSTSYAGFIQAMNEAGLSYGDLTEETYNQIKALDEQEQAMNDINNVKLVPKVLEIDANDGPVKAKLEELARMGIEDKSFDVIAELDASDVDGYTPPNKVMWVETRLLNNAMDRAAGGVINAAAGVAAGLSHYWVGERGPEPFFPAMDGRIVSNTQAMAALRGGAGVNSREIANAVRDGVKDAMRETKAGNVYNLTMPTSNNPADVRTAFELMEAWA